MAGTMVEFASNGGTANGYLATPDNPNGKALIVVQEWWGLQPEIEAIAERYADAGYYALAPDLFRGDKTDQPDEAQQKLMALNVEQAEKDLRGAVDCVAEKAGAAEVGSTGYCMGGALAIFAAALNPKVAAVSSFYYVFPHRKPEFSKIEGPVLMPYHGFFTSQAGKPTSLHIMALDDILRARGNRLLAREPRVFERLFEPLRHGDSRPAIVTDVPLERGNCELWRSLAPFYALADTLGGISETLRPVTGNQFTPTYIYLPVERTP